MSLSQRAGWIVLVVGLGGCLDDGVDVPPFPPPFGGPAARPLDGLVIADQAPPPIAGGTLHVALDERTVLASDPDRDAVWVANVADGTLRGRIDLESGDEPGRITEGPNGFYVALRSGGAVALIDGAGTRVVARLAVCSAPRGIDYDSGRNQVVVACQGGELVNVAADLSAIERTRVIDRDLRDVVVKRDGMYLATRFRAAELLLVDPDAPEGREPVSARHDVGPSIAFGGNTIGSVAWRMVEWPEDASIYREVGPFTPDVAIVHQNASGSLVPTTPGGGYYGEGNCGPAIVQAGVSAVALSAGSLVVEATPSLPGMVLPVDVAVNEQGQIATVAAGNRNDVSSTGAALSVSTFGDLMVGAFAPCLSGGGVRYPDGSQVVATAFAGDRLIAQTRDPWSIRVHEVDAAGTNPLLARIELGALGYEDRKDSGHDFFHEDSGAGIACASCHAEGSDDGVTWQFDIGDRRTQDLRGGILGTEPFHWSGDMRDFATLMSEVFTGRMAGPELPAEYSDALAQWVDSMPMPRGGLARDPSAVERGRVLFESADTQCATCHTGARLSNNTTVDVGTGLELQVPSLLGVGARSPLMHDGCASTLRGRFDPTCGGGDQHGRTSHLSAGQIDDLVAYMETL
jgi:mono/diheme cytochrome c family protein